MTASTLAFQTAFPISELRSGGTHNGPSIALMLRWTRMTKPKAVTSNCKRSKRKKWQKSERGQERASRVELTEGSWKQRPGSMRYKTPGKPQNRRDKRLHGTSHGKGRLQPGMHGRSSGQDPKKAIKDQRGSVCCDVNCLSCIPAEAGLALGHLAGDDSDQRSIIAAAAGGGGGAGAADTFFPLLCHDLPRKKKAICPSLAGILPEPQTLI